jgi:uncharacterized membrane-anchored protein YhcB (DUF1043 family)
MGPMNLIQQPIRPTLYVGLGGTGKEVLLRLRRRFYERFREGVPPCTRFLWMDTDTRDKDAKGEALDAALSAVGFEEQEKVPLLNGTVGKAAIDIFRNRQKWSYIHDWLYDEVERYGVEIADGAGGVRAVGRLMLMANFASVESALKNAVGELRQASTLLDTQNFYRAQGLGEADMDPTGLPMVCVVSSVAGGTGAGTLLDLTFLLRHLHATVQPLAGIASYVFLPNVYYSDPKNGERAGRSYGNAYAALKELDHFCLRLAREGQEQGGGLGIDFNVTWEDRNPQKVMGPPVSVTYLLEMKNTAGITLSPENRRELFSMVAESLYLDLLPGAFASAKRSDYSNIVQSLAGPAGINSETRGVKLPQTFSRRFASFGLSKIEVPQDMIRAACAAQLGSDVFGAYVLRDLPDQNVGMDVRNDMAQALLDRDGIPSLFGGEWKDLINRAVDEVFRGCTIRQPSDIDALGRKLEDLEKKLTYSLGNDKVRWGDVIKHLRNQAGPATEDGKKRVDALLRERALENPARGVRTAMRDGGYVDECIAGLKALGAPEEAGVPAVFPSSRNASAADAKTWMDLRARLLGELTNAIGSLTVKALGASVWTLGVLLERLKESAGQGLLCQAEACLFAEANKTAIALAKLLDQRKKELQKFVESAELYATESKARSEALQHVESSNQVLILRLYDKTQHWGTFYRLDRDEDSGEPSLVNPEKEYKRFAQGVGAGVGVLELAALLDREGRPAFSKRIDKYCEDRFADDFQANHRAVDVLEHPIMKERSQEYLQRLVNSALPMLQQNQTLGAMKSEVDHVFYVGVADPQLPKYQELAGKIGKLLRARAGQGFKVEVQIHATGNPSEIYLYLSDFAFSLPVLPIVTHDAHKAYWDFYEKINQAGPGNAQQLIPLHLSKRWEGKFEDLVEYSDEQANTLREILSILLFGHMLKVLVLKDLKGLHVYHYMLGKPFGRLDFMGPRRQVVASLLKDSKLRKTLDDAIKQRENSLTPEQLLSYFLAVQAASNSPELVRRTPDDLILNQQMKDLCARGGAALDAAFDRIKSIDEPLRFEYLRKLENSGIEWVLDSYPTVQSLPVWELPTEYV